MKQVWLITYFNDVFQYIQKIHLVCNQCNIIIKILYSCFYTKSSKSSMYFVFRALTTFQELSSSMWLMAAVLDNGWVVPWDLAVLLDVVKERQKMRNRISSASRMLVPCWWLLTTQLQCQVFGRSLINIDIQW